MRQTPRRQLWIILVCFTFSCVWAVGCDAERKRGNYEDTGEATQPDTNTTATVEDTGVTTAPDGSDEDTATADSDAQDDGSDVEPNDPGPKPPHQRETLASATGTLRAGIGLGHVSGPVGISQAGYGGRSGDVKSIWTGLFLATQGFYGYQSVKAIALEVDGQPLILMKLPTMSSESLLIDATVKKMKDLYGIDLSGRIITGATHSHHTNGRYLKVPSVFALLGTDFFDEEVVDLLCTEFARTIKRAMDDLGPAEWAFGYQDDWDADNKIYRDRRGENDPIYPKDPRLTLLAFRRPGGAPMATLINFGMHGTVFGPENRLLSEDAPGGLELKFEEYFYQQTGTPILGLFIQSGGGDASPAGDFLDHPEEARIELIGEVAAPRIFDLYEDLVWRTDMTLSVRSRRIDLRYKWMGYEEFPEFISESGRPYYWGGLQCVAPDVVDGESMEGHPKRCTELKAALRSMGETVPHGVVHQVYLTTARLDDIFLVSVPGEPAYSVIKYIREQIQSRSTTEKPLESLVFGYSQDHILYLTHPDDWFLGGYESQMSVWGPLAGKYIVDRQMEFVDDMLAGFNGPTFYEEFPSLIVPLPFEPRGFESSDPVGGVDLNVQTAYKRTDHVRFAFGGGDPSVGSPLVELQREVSAGNFEDVPHPAGFPGRAYDNSRYHMITRFTPNPPSSDEVLPSRFHRWEIDWQVAADFPAGRYRLVASGPYWNGSAPATYDIPSAVFSVQNADSAALAATLDSTTLQLKWTNAPVALVRAEEYWPLVGWRLLDPTARHDATVTVQAPLRVSLTIDGTPHPSPLTATFDPVLGQHTLDLAAAGIDPTNKTIAISAYIAADHAPAMLNAQINP